MDFTKFVKTQRKKHRLTQEDVAEKLGMSRQTYIKVEDDVRGLTTKEAKTLAKLFKMSLFNLLDCEEPPAGSTKKPVGEDERSNKSQEQADKFKQVFLYILDKVGDKLNVGKTVIYKLFYFIDFDYYEKYEEKLIGLKYIKNTYGPTPTMFTRFVSSMEANGEIEKTEGKFGGHKQTRYTAKSGLKPDLRVLNGRELKHIDEVLKRLSDKKANELSDLSHLDVPWAGAEDRAEINYDAVFYRTTKTSVLNYDDDEAVAD